MADDRESGPIDPQEVLRSLEDVRSRLRTAIWALHGMHQDMAALTVEEMRGLVGQFGQPPETVRATSDRHWTWVARKS